MPSPRSANRLAGAGLLGQPLVDDQPGGLPERLLAPLASAALDNALRRGQAALTGPVARGDADAVAAHLAALEQVDHRLAEATGPSRCAPPNSHKPIRH